MTRETVAVIGGCGHVGLPLAVVNASLGRPTLIYDINEASIATVRAGTVPFLEYGLDPLLKQVVEDGTLTLSSDPAVLGQARFVVLVVGTPVDEYLNPKLDALFSALEPCLEHFADGQTLILRSTVFPGTSRKIQDFLTQRGLAVDVAFCPERIAQGYAVEELRELPQIVSGFSERGLAAARAFFEPIAPSVIALEPLEAELAKLFTNAYRYIEFATVNQFYMIAESRGIDYHRIQEAIKKDYPRLKNLPGPGFAAGPCLLKDTMQLAAFYHHNFSLGHAALWINEGLPDFIVDRLRQEHPLREKTVGILGMAFKADNDDKRDSLAYRLRKLLRIEAGRTLCHDPYIKDPGHVEVDELLAASDIIIVAAPHREYRTLEIPEGKHVVDIWNCLPGDTTRRAS
ncbi:MAG: nucleotide sugar dehydrogenase [Planctomycetota bacterium]|jgi:UDP-N-acetyl-D-mannosaminuronic acid dehydrogenase